MREVKIHLDESGHVVDIHFDGKPGTPIGAFLLLTCVPVDPPAAHILAYGNSDTIGNLLLSFWKRSVEENPEGAWVLEKVARDIVGAADKARGEWPEEITGKLM